MTATAIVLPAVTAALLAFAYTSVGSVDRASYVNGNLRLLAAIPRFPGALQVSLRSAGWKLTHEPLFKEYTAGYRTAVTYEAPLRTHGDAIAAFYGRALTGWRTAGASRAAPRADTARTTTRCYAHAAESVCVAVMRGVRGSTRKFTVSVDYRLYSPRRG